jgi:hypothetical protein
MKIAMPISSTSARAWPVRAGNSAALAMAHPLS